MSRIITKNSSIPGKVPLPSDLVVGELAVNTSDGLIYTKHSDNSIRLVGSVSGGSTGTATIDFGSGSNEAQVTVSGQTGIASTSTVKLTVSADATSTSHTASDHRYFLELCSLTSDTPVANAGFTIYARSVHKLTGTWTIKYSWN